MTKYTSEQIEILPKTGRSLFDDGHGAHTPYTSELAFYDAIARGDAESVQEQMHRLLTTNGVVVGRMSDNPLRQSQYWAISCITLAARAVIAAGLPEEEALNFSDEVIRSIDRMQAPDAVLNYLSQQALTLTEKMRQRKARPAYPAPISAALREINAHLSQNPTCAEIAAAVKLHPDYLSRLFKSQFGVSLKDYIQQRRLHAARTMLLQGMHAKEVAYAMQFSSESHFIAAFRLRYGVTPRQFLIAFRTQSPQN